VEAGETRYHGPSRIKLLVEEDGEGVKAAGRIGLYNRLHRHIQPVESAHATG
jgi:hypothetical protein